MTMNAAQKERPGILQMTPSGKLGVTTSGHHSLRAESTRDKVGVGDGRGLAREHGLGTHDNTLPLPRFLVIILLIMVALLFIYGLLLECFCPNCRRDQHDIRTGDHLKTTEPPFTSPLESIYVSSLDSPPPYSQVRLSVPIPNVFHSQLLTVLS